MRRLMKFSAHKAFIVDYSLIDSTGSNQLFQNTTKIITRLGVNDFIYYLKKLFALF